MKRLFALFAALAVGMGLLISPASAATGDTPLKFGRTAAYADGLKVTISKPKAFRPGEYAMFMGSKSGTPVLFTIKVTNGTRTTIDPLGFRSSVSSGGRESGQVFDAAVGSTPTTKLLPGRSVTYTEGYVVRSLRDIVLEYNPDFWGREPVMFIS